ncbi:MAG: hypothetical protein HY719_14335 [Planctomycetes bacterium]|nr:hypothetical protein [Planctomycetota bacterium]
MGRQRSFPDWRFAGHAARRFVAATLAGALAASAACCAPAGGVAPPAAPAAASTSSTGGSLPTARPASAAGDVPASGWSRPAAEIEAALEAGGCHRTGETRLDDRRAMATFAGGGLVVRLVTRDGRAEGVDAFFTPADAAAGERMLRLLAEAVAPVDGAGSVSPAPSAGARALVDLLHDLLVEGRRQIRGASHDDARRRVAGAAGPLRVVVEAHRNHDFSVEIR